MCDEPLVAIVIVHFGSPMMTMECLQSIYASDYTNLRVIVVDNCPGQRLWRFHLEVEPSVTYILSSTNSGYCGGNNVGILEAEKLGAKYILLMNNDAIVERSLIKICVTYMEEHADISVISPKISYYYTPEYINAAGGELDSSTWQTKFFGLNEKDVGQFESEKGITYASGCAIFARMRVFAKVGLFDENLFCYGDDVDICRRIVLAGFRMRYIPSAKVWHKHRYREIDKRAVMKGHDVYYYWRNYFYNLRRYTSKNLKGYLLFGSQFSWSLGAFALKHRRLDLFLAMILGLFDSMAGRMGKREYFFLRPEK